MSERSARSLLREVGVVYTVVLVIIIAAAVLASFVGFVADLLYAIVAFLFFFVPQRILERKDADFEAFGLTTKNAGRGVTWGLLFTVVTIPFFIAGYWVWETDVLHRHYDFSWDHYRQWSARLEGEPKGWGKQAGVWIWSEKYRLEVGIRNTQQPNNRVIIEADEPFVPDKRGTIVLEPLPHEPGAGAAEATRPHRKWKALLTNARSRGVVTVDGPSSGTVRVVPVVDSNPRWPVFVGRSKKPLKDGPFHDTRDTWWIWMWVATQFVLIALPEEYFYRGYVQTRLEQMFAARASERGADSAWSFLGFTPAIFITSVLFGLGHLLVPVGGVLLVQRASVFFPSLLFGWLRRRTGTISSSIVYHACSNLMVLAAAVHFAG